ncbi:MAG: response regulator [Bacteroidota bacterium]
MDKGLEQQFSGKRVLVVEDDELFRRSLCGLVHTLGYEAVPAEAVDTALGLCRTTKIDLVLTDFQLTGKTGIDLISELQRTGMDIPSVIISGYSADDIREKAHGVAFAAFVKKPAELYRLQELLPHLLGEIV